MFANPSANDVAAENPLATAIATASPFCELQDQVLEALCAAADRRPYSAGETVFAMGQYDGSEFLIVESGKLKASRVDPTNGSMIFENIAAGEIFGLAFAVAGDGGEDANAPSVTIAADSDSVIIAVDSLAFREIAAQRPSLAKVLMVHFARLLLGGVAAADGRTPERRVYAALMEYIERDAVTSEWRIPRMPKHRELADRANVEEAEAANAVAKLIQSGAARRNYPGLIIDDIAHLDRHAR